MDWRNLSNIYGGQPRGELGQLQIGGRYLECSNDAFENSHAAGAGTDTSVADGELCGVILHLLVHRGRLLEETLTEKGRRARGRETIGDEPDPELGRMNRVAERTRGKVTWLTLEVSSARRWIIGTR